MIIRQNHRRNRKEGPMNQLTHAYKVSLDGGWFGYFPTQDAADAFKARAERQGRQPVYHGLVKVPTKSMPPVLRRLVEGIADQ